MWSTSKTTDRRTAALTGTGDFQLPVPALQGDAPVVWVDRSLLADLCREADRSGPDGASGYLAGHWASPGVEAVITMCGRFDPEHHSGFPRQMAIPSAELAPTRRGTPTTEVIGVWSATPHAKVPPRWPRACHRRLAREQGFSPSAAMLQVVLEAGTVWRPRLWIWSERRWWLPRAIVRPRAANVRLAAELKGA